LKRADLTYDDLADRLKKHGFKETKASIANKLARATVPASFFLACLAVMELEGVALADL
jgi:virulence-associated protein VapD